MSRFNAWPIVRGHLKGLTNDLPNGTTRPDWLARSVLVGISGGVLLGGLFLDWRVSSPGSMLSAMALLSAGLLGVFTQLSALRIRLTERADESWLDVERDGIDESVAHVLFAFMLCAANSALLTIGMNFATAPDGRLDKFWSAPVLGIGAYVVLLFVVLVPKLYSAYVEMNEVRRELNGYHRSQRR